MTKHVVVIDYGSGNVRSVVKALEHVAGSDITISLSSDPDSLAKATHIVLPGVGAFGDCMQGLTAIEGMKEALEHAVHVAKKPFLGICVGMQLLADMGLEHGKHDGLGWIKGKIVSIKPQNDTLKIPHMGWNELVIDRAHPITKDIQTGDHAYFVHSYHFECEEKTCIIGHTTYGKSLVAIVAKDNIVATQFHPEKSQKAGLQLLRNFIEGAL